MKQVLWVSRHEMTAPQKEDLDRVMGGPTRLILWPDTVEDVAVLEAPLQMADAAAVVLPPELLAQLLKLAGNKPVLRAISRRELTGCVRTLPDGRQEPETAFVHLGWERVLRLDIQTQRL